jgi:hypothetical protein
MDKILEFNILFKPLGQIILSVTQRNKCELHLEHKIMVKHFAAHISRTLSEDTCQNIARVCISDSNVWSTSSYVTYNGLLTPSERKGEEKKKSFNTMHATHHCRQPSMNFKT